MATLHSVVAGMQGVIASIYVLSSFQEAIDYREKFDLCSLELSQKSDFQPSTTQKSDFQPSTTKPDNIRHSSIETGQN